MTHVDALSRSVPQQDELTSDCWDYGVYCVEEALTPTIDEIKEAPQQDADCTELSETKAFEVDGLLYYAVSGTSPPRLRLIIPKPENHEECSEQPPQALVFSKV
eukprot:GHVN01045171.1.p1 GENE.GHVN01045171.1~~GHVN01045171.1.p1  ORF type:complete len:104 (+),score=17.14 GHVN01045171.1:687-998(+)